MNYYKHYYHNRKVTIPIVSFYLDLTSGFSSNSAATNFISESSTCSSVNNEYIEYSTQLNSTQPEITDAGVWHLYVRIIINITIL